MKWVSKTSGVGSIGRRYGNAQDDFFEKKKHSRHTPIGRPTQAVTGDDYDSKQKKAEVMKKKRNLPTTRKVVVERARIACVRYTAEVVLCVPANMTDRVIQDVVLTNSHHLPNPDAWSGGYRLKVKDAEEVRPTVIRDAHKHEASVATLVVDEQGFMELVADESGARHSTNG